MQPGQSDPLSCASRSYSLGRPAPLPQLYSRKTALCDYPLPALGGYRGHAALLEAESLGMQERHQVPRDCGLDCRSGLPARL